MKLGQEPACVVTCPNKDRVFVNFNDPDREITRLSKQKKLVQIIAPHVNTQPNIYYHEGTRLLDWAVIPTLPGNIHMPPEFWKVS